jgi:hypothetical protein
MVSLLVMTPAMALSQSSGFHINTLPKGAELTLPQPATLYVPLADSVTVSSTDSPQSLRIVPVNIARSLVRDVKIAIYEKNDPTVRRVTLKPGSPFLYNMKKLGSVTIKLDDKNDKVIATDKDIRLQIESDKPLSVRR